MRRLAKAVFPEVLLSNRQTRMPDPGNDLIVCHLGSLPLFNIVAKGKHLGERPQRPNAVWRAQVCFKTPFLIRPFVVAYF